MSTQVINTVIGNAALPFKRTSQFKTRKPEAISGKETSIADQTTPRYTWDIPFEVLRQGSNPHAGPWTEFSALAGFIAQMLGGYDSFLYTDPDDNSVTVQAIQNTVTGLNTGDGTTLTFQLQRTFGGAVMPILAPNVVTTVFVNGSPVSALNYSVGLWGSATPGIVTFGAGHAPGNGLSVTATFTYYFPCRFMMDEQEFEGFLSGYYDIKSLKFRSIK